MEHAIIINRINDLKYLKPKFRRVYFGNEFCPRLLSNLLEMETVIKSIKKKKKIISLLTPYADSEGLEKIKKIIKYSLKEKLVDEVVVNDWGVLNYLVREHPSFKIVIGRILSRALFPEHSFGKIKLERLDFDYMPGNSELKEFSKNSGKTKLSYYYPYTVIQGTRYCSVAGILNNKSGNHGIVKCSKECLRIGDLEIKNNIFTPKVLLRGCAQFVKNKPDFNVPGNIRIINRMVFQPRIPL